jgi:hypothetical protein
VQVINLAVEEDSDKNDHDENGGNRDADIDDKVLARHDIIVVVVITWRRMLNLLEAVAKFSLYFLVTINT